MDGSGSLKIKEARNIAARWLAENSGGFEGYVGAYLSGSTAWGDPSAQFQAGSDVDLFVVIDAQTLPHRVGKTLVNGVVLEINFVEWVAISDPEALLGDYHLAGAFICDGLLDDPEGRISDIREAVAGDFAKPDRVLQRCLQAKSRAKSFIPQFKQHADLHDQVTCLFFGAGVCAHMILVADRQNPTIRRRYVALQTVLQHHGRLEFHERLLASLGSAHWTDQTAQPLLEDVASSFDLACGLMRSPYQFASDMTEAARPIAVDGAAQMMAAGYPREAAFWLVAIAARSRAVVAKDGSAEQLAQVDVRFWRLLAQLGVPDLEAMTARARQIEADIDASWAVCEAIIYGGG